MSRRNTLRVIAVTGLLSAAVFITLPWLGCVSYARISPSMFGVCTFGFSYPGAVPGPQAYGLPGFTGPYWGNLAVGIAYVFAAVYVAVSKRV